MLENSQYSIQQIAAKEWEESCSGERERVNVMKTEIVIEENGKNCKQSTTKFTVLGIRKREICFTRKKYKIG
jgi:hypothetical protein